MLICSKQATLDVAISLTHTQVDTHSFFTSISSHSFVTPYSSHARTSTFDVYDSRILPSSVGVLLRSIRSDPHLTASLASFSPLISHHSIDALSSILGAVSSDVNTGPLL